MALPPTSPNPTWLPPGGATEPPEESKTTLGRPVDTSGGRHPARGGTPPEAGKLLPMVPGVQVGRVSKPFKARLRTVPTPQEIGHSKQASNSLSPVPARFVGLIASRAICFQAARTARCAYFAQHIRAGKITCALPANSPSRSYKLLKGTAQFIKQPENHW